MGKECPAVCDAASLCSKRLDQVYDQKSEGQCCIATAGWEKVLSGDD